MTRASPVNSFKSIIEEIGHRPSPPEWEEQFGIPTGTPWKEAVIIRLYKAIIEEGAYHLLGKIMEYAEPSTKRIDVEIRDWRSQMIAMGISPEVVAGRIQEMLGDAIEGEYRQIESGADSSASSSPEEPTSTRAIAVRRPADGPRDEEFSRRQKEWQAELDSDGKAETARGDTSV